MAAQWINARVVWPEEHLLEHRRQTEFEAVVDACMGQNGPFWLENRQRVVLKVDDFRRDFGELRATSASKLPKNSFGADLVSPAEKNDLRPVSGDLTLSLSLLTIDYVPLLLRRPGINQKLVQSSKIENNPAYRQLQAEGFKNYAPVGLSLFIRSAEHILEENKKSVFVLLGERAATLPVNPGVLQPSMDEGLSRGDLQDVFRFGIEEELGCPAEIANIVTRLALEDSTNGDNGFIGICTALLEETIIPGEEDRSSGANGSDAVSGTRTSRDDRDLTLEDLDARIKKLEGISERNGTEPDSPFNLVYQVVLPLEIFGSLVEAIAKESPVDDGRAGPDEVHHSKENKRLKVLRVDHDEKPNAAKVLSLGGFLESVKDPRPAPPEDQKDSVATGASSTPMSPVVDAYLQSLRTRLAASDRQGVWK